MAWPFQNGQIYLQADSKPTHWLQLACVFNNLKCNVIAINMLT